MFDVKFPVYGLLIIIALISNIIVVSCLFKKYNYSTREIICLLLYENVGIIGGAKIFSYLLSYKKFNVKFNFINSGLNSYGALFGASVFIIFFCWQFKKSFKETLFIFTPSFPLMYSIGKIGCFLAGCCYGIEYNGLFKIMYKYSSAAPNNVYLFPVQVVESIVFISVFIFMIYHHKKGSFNMKILGLSTMLCGIGKFILDFFRMSHTNFFSFNQIVSILFIIFGFIVYTIFKKERNKI